MTLYEFIALDEWEQYDAVWCRGVHIANRKDNAHTVMLYQLESFYVEVFYHRADNAITRLRPFSSTGQLEPYLAQIELTI